MDRAEWSDVSGAHDLARAEPLRMVPDHEGFRGVPAGARRSGGDRLGLRGIEADRLLAEHVLAGLQRTDGPRRMKMIGQGNVDRIDRRVGDQRLVAIEGAWQAQRRRGLCRTFAGGDRNDLGAPAGAHAGITFSRAIFAAPRTPNLIRLLTGLPLPSIPVRVGRRPRAGKRKSGAFTPPSRVSRPSNRLRKPSAVYWPDQSCPSIALPRSSAWGAPVPACGA